MEPAVAATLLENAVTALSKTDSSEGAVASLQAMLSLQKVFGSERQQDAVRTIFFNSQKLENHHQILDPNKTIAQGFMTNVITTNGGESQMGFITAESADKITLRNITGQEFTFASKDIKTRDKLEISTMPPGLVAGLSIKEFASLLDYLEELAKK